MRLAVFLSLTLLSSACSRCGAAGARPRDTADVQRRFTERLVKAVPQATVTPTNGKLFIHALDGGHELQLNVENLALLCAQEREAEACDVAIARAVENAQKILTAVPQAHSAECLRLVLKSQETIDGIAQMIRDRDAGPDNAVLSRPLAADLHAVLACDHPDGISLLTRGQARSLGLDDAALTARALENLAATLPAPKPEPVDAARGVYVVREGAEYASSQAFLPQRLDALSRAVDGGVVTFAVPTRDTLVFTAREDPVALGALAEIARGSIAQAYGLSAALVRVVDGGWQGVAAPSP